MLARPVAAGLQGGAQEIQRSTKNRVAIGNGQLVELCPEKRETVAMVIERLVGPLLGQLFTRLAQVERPDLSLVASLPTAQVIADRGSMDTRFFRQFPQGRLTRCFALLDGALYQLHACLRMVEQEDPGVRRG